MNLGYKVSGLHVEKVVGSVIKFSVFSLPFAIWKMFEIFQLFINAANYFK